MGMCLLSDYLVMNMYYDFTIPAFGRHVTIMILKQFLEKNKHTKIKEKLILKRIQIEK
jgi:hypothetical protein